MQAWVTRTRASPGSRMLASGTSSTRMSRGPWYTLAFTGGSSLRVSPPLAPWAPGLP